MSKKLKMVFAAAAVAFATMTPAHAGMDYDAANFEQASPAGTYRPLTNGEQNLVERFFGDAVNANELRIYMLPQNPDSPMAGAYNKNAIGFFGEDKHKEDYSKAGIELRAVFMHEITHVAQFQTRWAFCDRERDQDTYRYRLSKYLDFTRYGKEQQAAIIEDYTRRFLTPWGSAPSVWNSTYKDDPEYDLQLQRIVEEQFPGAKELRLEFSRPPQHDLRP